MIIAKLLNSDSINTLSSCIELFLNKTYCLSIEKSFIKKYLNEYLEIDNLFNLKVKKEKTAEFKQFNLIVKEIIGYNLSSIIEISTNFREVESKRTYDSPTASTLLLTSKIKKLEADIEVLNEVIEELRESYIRVKREKDGI